jgi:hypothetical protein
MTSSLQRIGAGSKSRPIWPDNPDIKICESQKALQHSAAGTYLQLRGSTLLELRLHLAKIRRIAPLRGR